MESKNEQIEQTQDEIWQIPEKDKWEWYKAVRGLIEHEDNLIGNRLSWIGAFQGLLFAALAFSWNEDNGYVVMILCGIGIGISLLSLDALRRASTALHGINTRWNKHVLIPNPTDKISFKLPPIWAWRKPLLFNNKKLAWLQAPWNYIPLILLVGWGGLLWTQCTRVDLNNDLLKPLSEEWQLRIYENLQKALVHKESDIKSDIKREVIAGIALVHGNANEGEEVFNRFCVKCHGSLWNQSNPVPNRDKLRSGEYDRKEVVRGILYPKPHMDDFTTLLAPRDLINVIEYLKPGSNNIVE